MNNHKQPQNALLSENIHFCKTAEILKFETENNFESTFHQQFQNKTELYGCVLSMGEREKELSNPCVIISLDFLQVYWMENKIQREHTKIAIMFTHWER